MRCQIIRTSLAAFVVSCAGYFGRSFFADRSEILFNLSITLFLIGAIYLSGILIRSTFALRSEAGFNGTGAILYRHWIGAGLCSTALFMVYFIGFQWALVSFHPGPEPAQLTKMQSTLEPIGSVMVSPFEWLRKLIPRPLTNALPRMINLGFPAMIYGTLLYLFSWIIRKNRSPTTDH